MFVQDVGVQQRAAVLSPCLKRFVSLSRALLIAYSARESIRKEQEKKNERVDKKNRSVKTKRNLMKGGKKKWKTMALLVVVVARAGG